jgi:hypothetical protein
VFLLFCRGRASEGRREAVPPGERELPEQKIIFIVAWTEPSWENRDGKKENIFKT